MILRRGESVELSRRIQSNHKNLLTSRVSVREGDVSVEAEVGVMHGQKLKIEGNLLKLEKAGKQILPWTLQKETDLSTHFRLLTSRIVR